MRARAALLLLALTPLLAVVSPSLPSPHPLPVAKGDAEVVRTVDGDTIYVRLAGGVEKVRYIGIDTPELHHPTRDRKSVV